MQFREVIAVYFENNTEYKHTDGEGKMQGYPMLEEMVCVRTTVF
jgi:hypothetical protein